MAANFVERAVPGVRSLKPYEAGKPISELQRELGLDDIIKLASNENPMGPSPKAQAAMESALRDLALYPDGNGFDLKRALCEKHGVKAEQITLGTGSDHILELIARVFLGEGRSAVFSRYGFAIYAIVSQAAGAELRVAEALPEDHPEMPYGHDLEAMAKQIDDSTRVVFIANPNNPTGTWIKRADMEAFLKKVPEDVLVVLDEAYFEYVEEAEYPDGQTLLSQYPNLLVMRTFSKAYGLAGIRVGYALASEQITDLLNRVRLAFHPNTLGQVAATAALGDKDHIRKSIEMNREERAKMEAGLKERGYATIPSVCNFVTVDTREPGREVFQKLLEQGVIVRPLDGYGLPNHVRVSVGLPGENQRFFQAFDAVMGGK
ncbi:histidinol-phosphate aminotransferase [Natronospira proteinivora]|uniref:Histidinol-phosphate aminotransferase n=1 Tax=Natronospira proteinivora TaxID=1807133 RepID=A0ABT1G6J9_9GAMM|nr:histidinol-phosphate transaminase [Natronospira proteinivora]MCP1726930.1 histidinol-phosphate aminotransferase [Natronospira proteinivora]